MEAKTCNHWTCNGCDKCGGWANNPDVEKSCTNQSCECHSMCDCEIKCDGDCHFQRPYGFVPHAGCPLHDSMTEEQRKAFGQVSFHPKGKSEKSHEYKTLEFYAHDYRDMAMSEDDLMDMLESYAEALNCKHECSSNCRRNGCNCNCGEYHL